MTAVPAAAITAAQQADREFGRKNGEVWLAVGHLRLASILEAAAPHLDAGGCIAELSTTASELATENIRIATGLRDARQRTAELEALKTAAMAQAAADAARIAELEQLATDLIAAFGKSDAGWRARLSGTVLDRHRATLAGQQ